MRCHDTALRLVRAVSSLGPEGHSKKNVSRFPDLRVHTVSIARGQGPDGWARAVSSIKVETKGIAMRDQRGGWLTMVSNVVFLLAAVVIAVSAWSMARQSHVITDAIQDGRRSSVPDQLQAGDQFPELRLVSLDGKETTLPELARQVKVLAVLTTTCPFCKQSLPAWNDVAGELEGHAMGFAGISLHSADQTREYVRDNEIAWPVLVVDPSAVRALGVTGVPRTWILRESGTINEVIRGRVAIEDGKKMLQTLGLRPASSQ